MSQPLCELVGEDRRQPIIHLAVANGFPPQTYLPLFRPLTRFRVVSLLPRALWNTEPPPTVLRDWSELADDLVDGLRAYKLTGIIAVGHSFGGIASILAAIREPSRFRALCLLDPTLLPPPAMEFMRQVQKDGAVDQLPLVQAATRRKRRFASIEDAYANFRSKPLFQDWSDEAVRLYADYGMRPLAKEPGVELAWSAEWEAYYYSTLYTWTWDAIPNLRGKLPILAVRGTSSDTFFPEAAEKLRGLLPEMAYAEVEGGHLFPQSAPDETRRILLDWIATLPAIGGDKWR